ncbi:MAG: hypothetical protein VYA17_01945 [Pseudomonadota bacterium]|nr:hypothetical protein [Pseudomonadota bacterium]
MRWIIQPRMHSDIAVKDLGWSIRDIIVFEWAYASNDRSECAKTCAGNARPFIVLSTNVQPSRWPDETFMQLGQILMSSS